jgi:hypothetical protein
MRVLLLLALLLGALAVGLAPLGAAEPMAVANTPATITSQADAFGALDYGPWNLQLATYGGKQFWTDQRILGGWRIQKNAVTRHYRLVDPDDVRHAWGTWDACELKLEEIRRAEGLQPPRGKVVIALHGLLRSRHQLQPLCDWLAKEGGYEVINFNYASSRAEVGEHADALAAIVEQCRDVEELNFVGHSLGNIVLRHYLGDCATGAHDRRHHPRLHRIVMLGPPNNGAEFAKRFAENKVFQVVWGKSGQQLADSWGRLEPRLATPHCEFGIIAGGLGTKIGFNPIVTGDDDGVVGVDETKLAGASDFMILPVLHGDLMDHAEVRTCILKFLREGHFLSAEQRAPLPTVTALRENDEQR